MVSRREVDDKRSRWTHFCQIFRIKNWWQAKRAIRDQNFATLEDLENLLKKFYVPTKTIPELLGGNISVTEDKNAGGWPKLLCNHCKMTNYTKDRCYKIQRYQRAPDEPSGISCQLCDQVGHIAIKCPSIETYQLCSQAGHTALSGSLKRETLQRHVCQFCNKSGHSKYK